MSDEQPAEQPEPADKPVADEAGKQAAEEKPKPDEGSEPEPEGPSAKDTASDVTNARKLHQDARAMENAIAALMGVRDGIGNVFVANTIGLVDAGLPRSTGIHHGSVPTGPISEEALRSATATFVEPANYGELRERLRDQWLVLLRAPSGWGRGYRRFGVGVPLSS